MRSVYVLLLLVVALAACGPTLPKYDYSKEPDPRNKEVVLGVGDTIVINVWGPENKELNTEATIRADGTITMPLVGDFKAAGQTPSELKKSIEGKVMQFVRIQPGTNPVTIALKAWKSYRFTITGEVVRQGVFTSEQFVTVADAIAMAGGLSRFAKRHELKLFRSDPQTKETRQIPLDYDMLASGERLDMNIYVLPGDTIYVP
jgi:polysaccharide biosynthesis/export protein